MSSNLQVLLGVAAYLTLDSLHDSSVAAKYASSGLKRKVYNFVMHSADSLIKVFVIYFIAHSFTGDFYQSIRLTVFGLALNYTLFAFEYNAWGIVFGLLKLEWRSLIHRGSNQLDRLFGKFNWLFRAVLLIGSLIFLVLGDKSNAMIDRVINGWTPLVLAIVFGFYLVLRFWIRKPNK